MSQIGFYPGVYVPITGLTGNNPVAVGPTLGNINIVGTAPVDVFGNDLTSTLTISVAGSVPILFTSDAGNATPALGVLTVTGGSNLGTTGAGSTITINLDNSPSVSGTLTAGTGISSTLGNITATAGNLVATLGSVSAGTTVTAGTGITATTGNIEATLGDVAIIAGNVLLPAVNVAGTQGILKVDGNRILTDFGTKNIFIGNTAGNTTLTVANAIQNTAIGYVALTLVTTGAENTMIGAYAGSLIDTGSNNTVIGSGALAAVTTGSDNIAIGVDAASALTVADNSCIIIGNTGTIADAHKIIIGTQGNGAGQQDSCKIAGIYGVTPGGTINIALVDSNGVLGSEASITVGQGGTGLTTLTDHAVLLGSGSGAITPMAVGNTGEVIVGNTGADASWSTTCLASTFDTNVTAAAVTLTGTTLAADGTDANIDINITPKGTADLVMSVGGIECSAAFPNSSIRSVLGYVEGYNISTVTNPLIAVTLNENGIYADGTNTDVDVSIIPKGLGAVSIDGLYGGTLESQWRTIQRNVPTANATPTILVTIPLLQKQMVTVKATINGFKDNYLDAIGGEVSFSVFRANGGNVVVVGDKVVSFAATAGAGATLALDAAATVGTQSADVFVIGVAAENWEWVATCSYMYTLLP